MVTGISPHIQEHKKEAEFSYFSRVFRIDWDKAHLFVDLVLIVSAVACAIFANLPPGVTVGIASSSLLILIIYNKAQWTRPSQTQINTLKAKCTLLSKDFKAQMSKNRLSQFLQEELEEMIDNVGLQSAQEENLKRKIKIYTRQKNDLRRTITDYCTRILQSSELARRKDRIAIQKIMKEAQKA